MAELHTHLQTRFNICGCDPFIEALVICQFEDYLRRKNNVREILLRLYLNSHQRPFSHLFNEWQTT